MLIEENVTLAPYNTFHIAQNARYFGRFKDIDSLSELITYAREENLGAPLVLGGGSNILLTSDVKGLVARNEIRGIEVVKEDDDHMYIRAGAGENWHELVKYAVKFNFGGLENLSLIPGNVGASPMQNIGAYGVEIKDVFEELEAVHLADGSVKRFSLEECEFGYRDSVFKNKYRNQFVITSVTYRLAKRPRFNTSYGAISAELEKMGVQQLSIQAISQAVINIRTSKLPDPNEVGNAGSFFKNPLVPLEQHELLKKEYPALVAFPAGQAAMKLAAGWLIEQCGWKGYRKGDAGCYPKQALVLVNYGGASGKDIYQLSEEIIASVQEKFGVLLEREVNII